jgi:hypothetical protein
MGQLRLRLGGLGYDDKLELEEQVSEHVGDQNDVFVEFEEASVPPGSYGEPVTLAVVVGGLAIKALIAFLVLRNRPDRFREKIEVVYPDGSRATHTIDIVLSKDRPASEQVLEALSKLVGAPVAELTG